MKILRNVPAFAGLAFLAHGANDARPFGRWYSPFPNVGVSIERLDELYPHAVIRKAFEVSVVAPVKASVLAKFESELVKEHNV